MKYYLIFVVLLLIACDNNQDVKHTYNIGKINSVERLPYAFNGVAKTVVNTEKINLVVYGYPSIILGEEATVRELTDGGILLCIESVNSCYFIWR